MSAALQGRRKLAVPIQEQTLKEVRWKMKMAVMDAEVVPEPAL